MAEVYRNVGGYQLDDWVAHMDEVGAPIKMHTQRVYRRAKIEKAKWVDEKHSYVEFEYGEVDGWVILNDERGKLAAMAMEYGTAPREGAPEGTPAQAILHKAAGIPLKLTNPRSRRRKRYVSSKRRRSKRSRDRRRRS